MIEQDDRRFHYFYNENFAGTVIDESLLQGQGLDMKLANKVIATYKWFHDHVSQLTNTNKVYLLVTNKSIYKNLLGDSSQYLSGLIDINDFVTSHRGEFPELDNFLGFTEEDGQIGDVQMADEEKNSPFGY